MSSKSHSLAVLSALVVIAVVAGLFGEVGANAQAEATTDALRIVKDNEAPSATEIAVRLSEATALDAVETVVVGRSDVFADSLAAGVLQSGSPLMLVPPQGPVPDRMRQEIDRLAPQRVILLGGVSAIGQIVEDELSGTYQVERRAGATRIETAVEIARSDAPDATQAVLARAFAGEGEDQTQAFADALAGGGLAAETGWPILLTQTNVLTSSTREYLATSAIEDIQILGGTAAISESVVAELEGLGITTSRVAGANRAGTALEIAKLRGADDARDVSRVTVVEGQGENAWVGGFTAAAHSAVFDAPILLSASGDLPPETQAFLEANQSRFAVDVDDGTQPVLTCVTDPEACEKSRIALGLPPAIDVTFDPPSAFELVPGSDVTVTVDQSGFAQQPGEGELVISGDCLAQPVTATMSEPVTVTTSADAPVPCSLAASLLLSNGATQTATAVYPGGTVSGTVRSATTGEPLPGASVTLGDGTTILTGVDGTFAFAGVLPGATTVAASAEGYSDGLLEDVVVTAGATTTVDVLLSPTLSAGSLRVVLSWAEEPRDLDSHMWTPETQPYHVYFGGPGSLEGCPGTALDLDDTSGFGPETITIQSPIVGTYRYGVRLFGGVGTLSQSMAVVEVFDTSGLIARFEVPQNGTAAETWWHVFDADPSTGSLTPVDRLYQDQTELEPYTLANAC